VKQTKLFRTTQITTRFNPLLICILLKRERKEGRKEGKK
jgi:hypothetical protein